MSLGFSNGFVMLAALLAADPTGMYLPPSETGGAEFQFNPASADLRQAVKAKEPRRDDLVDARALAEDLLFLRRGLRKLYIGYPELLQLPDFDVEALFDQQVARLRSGPAQVKFGDSVLAVFLELKRHINDRHFWMSGWDPDPRDDYNEYQTPINGPAPSLEKCAPPGASPTTLRVAPLLAANGKRSQTVTVSVRAQSETLELACAEQHLTLRVRPRVSYEEGIWDKPAYEWRRAGQAAIIRIRRFQGPPAELERLEQLAKDYPEHRRAPLIVFDMRGNGGGNDEYAYRWIAQAKRGAWDSGSWSMHPTGAFIPWLLWNQEVWAAIEHGRVDDPASVAKRNELRAKWPRSAAELSLEFKGERNRNDAKAPYQGRIFVLVDRRSASSGESAAIALRDALGAKVVGERSAGFLEYGNVRPLALPRTHLRFWFATKRNYFPTPVEAVGMPVDVYLAPELMTKPAEELIPLLKKLPG